MGKWSNQQISNPKTRGRAECGVRGFVICAFEDLAIRPFEDSPKEETTTMKITAIKALQPKRGATLVRVETDAGVVGYGQIGRAHV